MRVSPSSNLQTSHTAMCQSAMSHFFAPALVGATPFPFAAPGNGCCPIHFDRLTNAEIAAITKDFLHPVPTTSPPTAPAAPEMRALAAPINQLFHMGSPQNVICANDVSKYVFATIAPVMLKHRDVPGSRRNMPPGFPVM